MNFSKKKGRRLDNEVNAGSMADIAFLLLIFFLVTTVILEDKGIMVQLPPYKEDVEIPPVPPRNLLSVKVNAANQILLEGEQARINQIKERAMEFVLNPEQRDDLPNKPTKAVISLQNDRGTNYETYLAVYNELKAAYNEMWKKAAMHRYKKPYEDLTAKNKKSIRDEIPLLISEAEPTDHNPT